MKLSAANLNALLSLFVADEITDRPSLEHPMEQDGYVCATDAHIAIRIPKQACVNTYEPKDNPRFSRVVPASNPAFIVSIDAIEKAIVKCGLDNNEIYDECLDCRGDGFVEWEYTDVNGERHTREKECPVCEGTGRSHSGEFVYIQLGDWAFSAHYLIRLRKAMLVLEADTIEVTPNKFNGWLFEPGAGVEIVLAPCNVELSKTHAAIKTTPKKN